MNQTEIIEVVRQSIIVTMQISAPVMLIGLVVGVVVALFQALTQIQEMTLVFVPKMMAIFIALFALLPFMTNTLIAFTQELMDKVVGIQ